MLTFIGEPLAMGAAGATRPIRIVTVFPQQEVIVTVPGIHATQRQAYLDQLDEQRRQSGRPPLNDAEQESVLLAAVDLIVEDKAILIRPDPERMDLAFAADALLQTNEIARKRAIRFLFVNDQRVRDAIRQRGEAWRICPLPKSAEEIVRHIQSSVSAVGGQAIYYYNVLHGTRVLTWARFAALASSDDAALRQHLCEISALARGRNKRGYPELELFMAGPGFTSEALARSDWATLPADQLRACYADLCRGYQAAVPVEFQQDNRDDKSWRKRMYAALIDQRDDELSEEDLLGMGAEFFMQVEWLPGVRIESGELIFDMVADDAAGSGVLNSSDTIVRGLICNLVQEFNGLEFINLGRVIASLSHRRNFAGRREVYVAHFRERGAAHDTLQMIRMQKWGVREHLDEGKGLLQAMVESEEYTDYIMDRRLACKQLGMNLSPRTLTRKVTELYDGAQRGLAGTTIWSPYFQRDYIAGLATDKIPSYKLKNPTYANGFATLLGAAAAINMIVGRCAAEGYVIFDDGDEVVIENAEGMPAAIIVADHTGTFQDHTGDLLHTAAAYAASVNDRLQEVADPAAFAQHFLDGFRTRFHTIQQDYQNRRRAYDGLFKHRRCDPGGNLAFRWKVVLRRLEQADADALMAAIKANIKDG